MNKSSYNARPNAAIVLAAREYALGHQPEMIAELRALVELESPSSNKQAVDRLGQRLVSRFEHLGGAIKLHRSAAFGDHLEINFFAAKPRRSAPGKAAPLLLLGHMDTVWDVGTLAHMPFKLSDGRLWGPGVLDMKAGIVMMMFSIAALKEFLGHLPRPVKLLLNSDEEVGSDSSRPITEALAKTCAAVLVCEPAQGLEGAVKTSRKGVGNYLLKVHGKPSHAGVDFERGASAIVELARQIGRIVPFTDPRRGITVNPGVIRGGTRSNVVAAEASVEIDLRIQNMRDAPRVERKLRSLRPFDPRCHIEVLGGINRPPMERSKEGLRLYRQARDLARSLDFALEEKSTGGGSDGNFTAALGVPTLDGLGAVGEGAHALNESILLAELPRRTALLAGLLASAI